MTQLDPHHTGTAWWIAPAPAVVAPTGEPALEPFTERVAEPAPEPAPEPAAEPAAEPAPEPEAQERRGPVPTPGDRPAHDLPVLEGFRGIAALMVLLTHVGYTSGAAVLTSWAGWLSRLDLGVSLFFLLSGFLLFRPFVQAAYGRRRAVELRPYLRRRFVRIYPAFLVALAANWFLSPRARDQAGQLWLDTGLLIQNYKTNFAYQLDGLVQVWSLVVEVSFYVTLPVIALLVLGRAGRLAELHRRAGAVPEPPQPAAPTTRRAARDRKRPGPARRALGGVADLDRLGMARPAWVLGLMTVVALAWRYYYTASTDGVGPQLLWLPSFLDWFAAGMALAWLRERDAPVPRVLVTLANAPGVCWSLALLAYWLLTPKGIGGPYDLTGATVEAGMLKHLVFELIAVLMVLPAMFGDRRAGWRSGFMHPWMGWFGRISFGVFLWHPMLMGVVRQVLGLGVYEGGFWITLVFTVILSLVAGELSWRFVEEPLQRRWRDGIRISRPRRRPKGEPPPEDGTPEGASAGASAAW